jgi:hypothetical protein
MKIRFLVLTLGEKPNNKECHVVVDRNIIISGQTGSGKSSYAKMLADKDERIEFITDEKDLDNLKPTTKLAILDDVYKIEDQDALQEKIFELNKKEVYVALIVISSKHVNKIPVRDSYILRVQKGFEDSRSIIFEDGNNTTQLIYEL